MNADLDTRLHALGRCGSFDEGNVVPDEDAVSDIEEDDTQQRQIHTILVLGKSKSSSYSLVPSLIPGSVLRSRFLTQNASVPASRSPAGLSFLLVPSGGVGKSTLTFQFVNNTPFFETEHFPTILGECVGEKERGGKRR